MERNRKGWIKREDYKQSVYIDNNGNTIPITTVFFPNSIPKMGLNITALAVAHYIQHGEVPEYADECLEGEIKLAIGDKG